MDKENAEGKQHSNAEKPISLKPLQFDEAVSDLLKVKPEKEIKGESMKDKKKPKLAPATPKVPKTLAPGIPKIKKSK